MEPEDEGLMKAIEDGIVEDLSAEQRRRVRTALFDYWECQRMEKEEQWEPEA